jgi:trehalose synthase-fused probable maltokinase
LLRVRYSDGSTETYFTSLSVASGAQADSLKAAMPDRVLCRLQWNIANALLYESSLEEHTWRALLEMIDVNADTYSRRGLIRARQTAAFAPLRTGAGKQPTFALTPGEQSNTSAFYGDRLMLKLYRKPEAGPNPEFEILRYLTENDSFDRAPLLAGCIEYAPFEGDVQTVAILVSVIENQGTAWEWMLEELSRFYEHTVESAIGIALRDAAGLSLEAAATLGRRSAELHLALAKSDRDPAFAPEPFTPADLALVIDNLRTDAARTFKLLQDNLARLPEGIAGDAERLLLRQDRLVARLQQIEPPVGAVFKTRIHGDYHLGQVLRVKNDYVIIDFEGEPARSLLERRAKSLPLKDVAGMLRSFSYAAYAALLNYMSRRPDQEGRLANSSKFWVDAMASSFLGSYCERAQNAVFLPKRPVDLNNLIDRYVLEKAFYELRYEINHRPAWVGLPLHSIAGLMES